MLTREEAIERLNQNKAAAEFYASQSRITAEIENALKDSEAFDVAIEALQTPTDGDLIRREGILHELAELSDSYEKQYPNEKEMIHGLILICRKAILNYPSADRPTETFGTMCGQSDKAIEYALEQKRAGEEYCYDCEAVQGEWIDRSDGGRIKYPWWESCECNKCGEYGSGAYNFCPNCGARMKGGDTE